MQEHESGEEGMKTEMTSSFFGPSQSVNNGEGSLGQVGMGLEEVEGMPCNMSMLHFNRELNSMHLWAWARF